MPRDPSGNYTLPALGNPAVTNTPITIAWWNGTSTDLAAAMTDSLSRTGSGGMLGAFGLVDGTAGAPGLTFQSETTTGLYRATAGEMDVTVGTTRISRWTSAGFQTSFDGGATWYGPVYLNRSGQTFASGSINFAEGTLTYHGNRVAAPVFTASSSCGAFSTTSTSYTQITNFSLTFTATGGLVQVMFLPANGATGDLFAFNNTAGALNYKGGVAISTDNGSTFTGEMDFGYITGVFSGTEVIGTTFVYPASAYQTWITPAAGSVTLKGYAKAIGSAGTPTAGVNNAVLCIVQY